MGGKSDMGQTEKARFAEKQLQLLSVKPEMGAHSQSPERKHSPFPSEFTSLLPEEPGTQQMRQQ